MISQGVEPAGAVVLPRPRGVENILGRIPPRLAALLGVAAIVALSLVPGNWRPSIGLAKALEHFVAYFVVGAVLRTAFRAGWPHICGLVAIAGMLEVAQDWIPGRNPSLIDFLGSSSGALLGFGLWSITLAGRRAFFAAGAADEPAQGDPSTH